MEKCNYVSVGFEKHCFCFKLGALISNCIFVGSIQDLNQQHMEVNQKEMEVFQQLICLGRIMGIVSDQWDLNMHKDSHFLGLGEY